ncbi:hypothetical protein PINS_up014140 [Pythium insidiosum]|nr:hypothetical protein PINS_up014140 [Pythium insidiosum]
MSAHYTNASSPFVVCTPIRPLSFQEFLAYGVPICRSRISHLTHGILKRLVALEAPALTLIFLVTHKKGNVVLKLL